MHLALLLALAQAPARPALRFADPAVQERLGPPFESALENLLDVNTVPYDSKTYNPTGLLTSGRFVRAGGGYDQPWTRDAAINSWNAASLFEPVAARDTLWSVTRPGEEGPIVQRDNQWWDKVIWAVGAWNHYLVTGDRPFLEKAYGVAGRLMREMRADRYNAAFGLFQGPSFFNDGIAGYPAPPAQEDDGGSSFVLDHPGADRLMALSTNCLYVGAYDATAAMARELKLPSKEWTDASKALKGAIDRRFWMPVRGTYGYLLFPDDQSYRDSQAITISPSPPPAPPHRPSQVGEGRKRGTEATRRGDPEPTLDPSQEGCGLAFAALFGVASPERARRLLRGAHVDPWGIADVWPAFPRFSDERPGRHNDVVWPMVQGMWARAAAQVGDRASLEAQTNLLARLARGSEGRFFEIYDAKTGEPNGGWQNGHAWDSQPDQTWSATAYLGMVTNGLFGMRFEPKGLRFSPLAPAAWGDATLTDLPYRGMTLDIALHGSGTRVRSVRMDGQPLKDGLVPAGLTGKHTVEIAMR